VVLMERLMDGRGDFLRRWHSGQTGLHPANPSGQPWDRRSAAMLGLLSASRYGELEKQIERETDPAKKALLERDLLRAQRVS
jgi:hypothetical protein